MDKEKQTHKHEWVENKTTFKDKKEDGEKESEPTSYVLSRYCEGCGDTQTYHGKEKYWILTGNLYE